MLRQFLNRFLRRSGIFLISIAAIVVTYVLWQFFSVKAVFIPETFFESKRQSALIAQNIAELSAAAAERFSQIRTLEKRRRYSEALEIVTQEVNRVSNMREKASELLSKLADMTRVLSEIRPDETRSRAMEAINYQVSVINHLIAYNNDLDQLLRLLASQLLYGENIDSKFDELVNRINVEAQKINELNQKFNAAIDSIKTTSPRP